ncbi:efflux RND transporter periplasmic adaptor subunit [Salipiger bermudensis]|uniref:efflux RND transporter periplasmic adaptor subunit n=1 Tax=Salipiger bermudensis TaxID=344736 RepID=UPI0021BD0237|nr:efflux RND transporter periplasmic adaptor subunit [Salipiger bermudensis]
MPACPRISALLLGLMLASPALAEPHDCLIEPQAVISLTSTEQGRIDEVLVRRGDRVRAGQPLIRLEDTIQSLQLEMASAKAGTDVELRAAAARVAFRRESLERSERLFAKETVTEASVEDKRIELTLSEMALEEALLARDMAQIERRMASALLDRRTITSPVDGIVLSVEAAAGEFASDTEEMLVLAEMDPLLVEVFVPLDYFDRIAVGDSYQVAQVAPLDGLFEATVRTVDRVFDAASGTFGVQLEMANPGTDIPAGTRCTVDFDQASN